LKKKGWNPSEEDIPSILFIHNSVNEESWNRIREWEKEHSDREPTLLRFEGKPKDLSPKAAIYHYLLGYSLPFDRHDWFVQREDGEVVRYVIDFYNGKAKEIMTLPSEEGQQQQQQEVSVEAPVSIHLDVRPAIDSVDALKTRMKKYFFD
jgi:cytochrome c heme-lyase